jgi:hypothetical protein
VKNFRFHIIVFFFFLFLISGHTGYGQESANFYGQKIFSSPQVSEDVMLRSVADLKFYLEKATKRPFSTLALQTTAQPGIYLQLNEAGKFTSDLEAKLSKGSIEDFVIKANKEKILLIAYHPLGLSRAIYYYLDQLGFRWYFPGSRWEHIPTLADIGLSRTEFIAPSFKLRNFSGTGAIAHVKSKDPEQVLQREWEDWKRRNRMGGEVELAGHYGETFNIKHQPELEKNPEYLALVGGKRTAWKHEAKWCISNPGFRKLFIKDRTQDALQMLANARYSTNKVTVSVDPADGYGDCECAVCRKMGSNSDRVFFLASETAKELAKLSPRLYANIYAYNTHVAPPPFALAPNLIVQIIPYAFQNVASPTELIRKWKSRHNNLLIYDYFGIPDWSFNLPLTRGQSDEALLERIRYWKEQGLEGFMLESSNSIGSNGTGLYFAGRLGWDVKTDIKKEKTEFYKNMFGAAAATMQEYYEKVSHDFNGVVDVAFLMQILGKAKNGAAGIAKDRITDLQAYLHFVSLYYKWQSAKPDLKEKQSDELLNFGWQIYPTAMVHSTRMVELLIHNFPISVAHTKSWNHYEPNPEKLKKINFLSRTELEALANKDLKENPLLQDFVYKQKNASGSYILSSVKKKEAIPEGLMLLDIPETYLQSSPHGNVHFFVKLNESSENNISQAITIECINVLTGLVVETKQVTIDKRWQEISFKVPENKTFKISIKNNGWIRFYAPPDQWAGFKNIPMYAVMGPLWFYVPAGERYIYYSNAQAEQPSFIDGSGKAVIPQKTGDQNIYRLQNNNSSSGSWWLIQGAEYKGLQFYGKPDFFFSRPDYSYKPAKL